MPLARLLRSAAAALLVGSTSPALAVCPQDGAKPFTAGPVDPVNGFAQWVQDSEGVTLELCLDPANCLFDPPIAGNAFSELIGFGPEAFWWLSETEFATESGLDALIVMAAEAAFAAEIPAIGEQFPFTRLRIRVDVPIAGIYTVTHPYGQIRYVIPTPGVRAINDSFDITFRPDAVNQGRVGPWLRWDATLPPPPAGFIGDGVTPHTVTGSPCGTNFFRISAVALNGITPIAIDPDDEDGDDDTSRFTTRLFTVSGRMFRGNVPTPLLASASYSAGTGGRLNVFATAPTTATVTFSGLPGGAQPLTGDGAGRYFASVALEAGAIPDDVTVTDTNDPPNDNNDPTTLQVPVDDLVRITRAEYSRSARTLTIEAASSDGAAPTLRYGTSPLVSGALTVGSVFPPPATVTVISDGGGSDTEPVKVVP